ncbi:MAG: monovalent cation/H(+) antiporter subunit G [Gemmatimonadota bacterium]
MAELLVSIAALVGAALVFVAALGVLRMPDLYSRMHAATKAGALGSGLLVLAAAAAIGETSMTLRAVATIVFIFLTAPVAAHALGRAVFRNGRDR